MLNIILQALYFFLPAYISNAMPVLLEKFSLFKFLKIRVDFGTSFRGNALFGETKTYRGIFGGVLGGLFTVFIQALIYFYLPDLRFLYIFPYDAGQIIWLGILLGFGEGLGDLIKSFFKRRLNLKSSAPAFPLDQTSFLGALLLGYLFHPLPWQHLLVIILISPLVPLVANMLAYRIGWKKVWW